MTKSKQSYSEYKDATICNIHSGNNRRSHFVYAHILDKDGELLVSATLDYCVERMTKAALANFK